jgi:hypothetical protein
VQSKLNINGTDIAHRLQGEKEINNLIVCVLGDKKYLTFEDFKETTLKTSSDWFLIVLFFF